MSRCYKCLKKLDEKDAVKELVRPSERNVKESLNDEPKLLYRHREC